MKPRENPFRISALNSLKVHQIPIQNQKQLNNTFKGGNDLRKQLNKNKNTSMTGYKKTLQTNTQLFQQTFTEQKPQREALMDEVAALDNFKAPVTREKTKNLIENIKLRRREKHIQAYNNFKEDLDDYKQNLLHIYESLYNDCSQVLSIKQTQLSGYFHSQTDEYLLGREKDILQEFDVELFNYEKTSHEKIAASKEELERIRNGRGSVVDETCEMLRLNLIEIAFVLENEAREIEANEKENIGKLEVQFYEKYKGMIDELQSSQEQKNEIMREKMHQVIKHWRQLKESHQITHFENSLTSQPYKNSQKRQQLYQRLITLQQENHQQKKKYLESLIINEHVDSFKKANIEKWFEVIKAINDDFDKKLDDLVKELIDEMNESKQKHGRLIRYLQERLRYIQNHTPQEITQMLTTRFQPMVDLNTTQAEQTLKSATSYVQLNDQKQNTLIENLYKFFLLIGQNNDDFVKDFTAQSQKYQLEKAKVLDDDEELVEKLTSELETFKRELKESLHHIKLEQIQKKCFEKIDEIQVAYRRAHQLNKELTAVRPKTLTGFMQGFQQKMAFIFQLYEFSKRAELVQKNKQDAEKQALRRIEQEDKKKSQEEEKQLQLIKKNGGKLPPPAKPKDPKKLAAQIEQRKKVILASMGEKKIQEIQTGSGNTWLVYKTLEVIAKEFYKASLQQGQKSDTPLNDANHNQDPTKVPLQIDQLPQQIHNSQGQPITTKETLFKISEISQYLLNLRDKIFNNINVKKTRILAEAAKNDEEMMEDSLTMLDDRLKKHYSLKGELEAQIFVKRSGEITNHKKRYEKYARVIREKMDQQTQRFNFLLEKSLEHLKQHNTAQKQLREQLPSGKNLSELQGMLTKARQNFNKFTNEIHQIVAELNHLAKTEVDILLEKNKDFIKESRLIKDGGEYSEDQIKWYQQMMGEITTQIKTQQSRREQKCKEIQEQSQKRKKELLQKIQKNYHSSIEELSAKDGTGKVYGKPKRIAQEKLRLQMNKCQQSQISIDKQIEEMISAYQKERSHGFRFQPQQKPQTLKWRRQLMTLWTCIDRYTKHLEALKKDLRIKPMLRVNYDQNLPECTVSSLEEDKKLIEEELKTLGPLGEQKEDKPFSKFVLDIQKLISDECRAIYVGDKAKYLTGADKLPDFLRKYIASMKQSAEDFRQNSIRQLRESCIRLSDLCQKFTELFVRSIESFYVNSNHKNFSSYSKQFTQIYNKHDIEKTENLRLLRPNLSNPKCQDELKKLNEKELSRQSLFIQQISTLKQHFKSAHFANGQQFINILINNYEFLLFYCDSLLLFEDFIKINGDDDQDKTKLNIKKLMIMKQKGISIDSASQRNLKKKWEGVNFTLINFDDKKYAYKKVEVQDPTAKDPKKAAKKDAKKPANQPAEQLQSQTISRPIETFKTWRQKSVFENRQKCQEVFAKDYSQTIAHMYAKIDESLKQNEMFNKKWTKIASELTIK